jgi:hypothetical protein
MHDEEAEKVGANLRRDEIEPKQHDKPADQAVGSCIGFQELREPYRHGQGDEDGQEHEKPGQEDACDAPQARTLPPIITSEQRTTLSQMRD